MDPKDLEERLESRDVVQVLRDIQCRVELSNRPMPGHTKMELTAGASMTIWSIQQDFPGKVTFGELKERDPETYGSAVKKVQRAIEKAGYIA